MKLTLLAGALGVLLSSIATAYGAVLKVTQVRRYIYTTDRNRFYVKGIVYQTQGEIISGPDNPLDRPSTFQLGINAIRAYSVDSILNHDSCMSALSRTGIYVMCVRACLLSSAMTGPGAPAQRLDSLPTWSTNLRGQYIKTINVFSKYDNVLAYNVGNEVLTSRATNAALFIEVAAHDIKAYSYTCMSPFSFWLLLLRLLRRGGRASISSSAPVGYADIDGAAAFCDAVAQYLSCDPGRRGDEY
ncbi:Glucanosyltransferase-domain-containing protein [Mycena sanguinolenta]|nr:Glucanosyltransferase-domain-containing protein [Mycena sanguinolenta]